MDPMDQVQRTAGSISRMEIRGAGRIATAAAASLRDFALTVDAKSLEEFDSEIRRVADLLNSTRPTAVSLSNAIRAVTRYRADDLETARRAVVSNANRFIENSEKAVQRIGQIGSRTIKDGDTVLTHCNSMAAFQDQSCAQGRQEDQCDCNRVAAEGIRNRNHWDAG
jgi:ribose 1,5-bisphosphate isomerase